MAISRALRQRIHKAAKGYCGYCLVHSQYVYAIMEIDHIKPTAAGGTDEESNLWLACPRCNTHKSDQIDAIDSLTNNLVPIFNPRTQNWSEHFNWDTDNAAVIVGLTPYGRATIGALKLNFPQAVEFRTILVNAGWYPPTS